MPYGKYLRHLSKLCRTTIFVINIITELFYCVVKLENHKYTYKGGMRIEEGYIR